MTCGINKVSLPHRAPTANKFRDNFSGAHRGQSRRKTEMAQNVASNSKPMLSGSRTESG